MTLSEMRIIAVLAFFAIGLLAIVLALGLVHLRDAARRLNAEGMRDRALPSRRGDAPEAARLIDHRQAAWRLRC